MEPLVEVMRSQFVEVMREAGRAVANMCCHPDNHAECLALGGHQLLISFLLSPDPGSQRVGALGVGNLATNPTYRGALVESGVLEPLLSLCRATDVEGEMQRYGVLALAALCSSVETHEAARREGAIPLLVSMAAHPDEELRQYAAFCLVRLAHNSAMRAALTEEGALEPVLYLARTEDAALHREVLPALANLSFEDGNKLQICRSGGLPAMLAHANDARPEIARQACAALANMAEVVQNHARLVDQGCMKPLIKVG